MRTYLNETFRPFSIPYNARYVDTVEIGSNVEPGLGLEVYIWEGETDGKSIIKVYLWYCRSHNHYFKGSMSNWDLEIGDLTKLLQLSVTKLILHECTDGGYYTTSFTTKLTQPGEPWNGAYCLPVSNTYTRGISYYKEHRSVFLFTLKNRRVI